MKLTAKVTHVTLKEKLALKGITYTKTLYDGVESMRGIKMQLFAYGVLCELPNGTSFVVPYINCASIVCEEEVK